ncbi:MAG: class I SAM-dependent methyltransferase [Acidobacteriota bacterium]
MPNQRNKNEDPDFFIEKYSRPRTRILRQVERTVLGHECGLNGYTTVEQARKLGELLHLNREGRLLDIGGGFGWPGLDIARSSGCSVVSTDLPLAALLNARANAQALGLSAHAQPAAADGRALPFRSASFDAVTHADVI